MKGQGLVKKHACKVCGESIPLKMALRDQHLHVKREAASEDLAENENNSADQFESLMVYN